MLQALEEARTDLDSPTSLSSASEAALGYFLPEDAFRQLEAARDVAGFVHDLAAEVERNQVPVSPGKLVSLLQMIIANLDQALGEGTFDSRPAASD